MEKTEVSEEMMQAVRDKFEADGNELMNNQSAPDYKLKLMQMLFQYSSLIVGETNSREIAQRIVELEFDSVTMYLLQWDLFEGRVRELNEEMNDLDAEYGVEIE